MTKDLKMSDSTLQYNTAVTLFFVPYTLLEVPSNIILKKMRPSYWMAILLLSWGTCMTLMALVSSYSGLLAGRFFLGVTEVCIHVSYTRRHMALTKHTGWVFPCGYISAYALVPPLRAAATYGRLLHRRVARGRLFRAFGLWY